MAIVKDAMMNLESDSETGAKKLLVVGENAPFNRVETTMALDGRATLASSAHFNASTHCYSAQRNALFGSEEKNTVHYYSATLASKDRLYGSFNNRAVQFCSVVRYDKVKCRDTNAEHYTRVQCSYAQLGDF